MSTEIHSMVTQLERLLRETRDENLRERLMEYLQELAEMERREAIKANRVTPNG